MPPSETFYDVLDVPPNASSQDIKAAYRRLARKFHPDVNPDNSQAEARFKAINEAYATLSSDDKRQQYNLKHHIGQTKSSSANPNAAKPNPQPPPKSPPPTANTRSQSGPSQKRPQPKPSAKPQEKPSDKSGSGKGTMDADKFKAFFDTMFAAVDSKVKPPPPKPQTPPPSQEPAQKPQPQRGDDITLELSISTDEVKQGLVKTVNVEQSEPCKRCSGTGKVNGAVCTQCHGDRKTTVAKKITVKVPAGVKEGSKVRVAKEGAKGLNGGEPGDLYLTIRVQTPQSSIRIEGINAYCDLDITMPDAVLGTEASVSTPTGSTRMTIPPHTQSGQVFRLKGQGVSSNGQTGDLMVTIRVVTPTSLTPHERQLYEELARQQKR